MRTPKCDVCVYVCVVGGGWWMGERCVVWGVESGGRGVKDGVGVRMWWGWVSGAVGSGWCGWWEGCGAVEGGGWVCERGGNGMVDVG